MANNDSQEIHRAAYEGDLNKVRELLKKGVDPNLPHDNDYDHGYTWISGPSPLNKICIAWGLTNKHIEIAKLLIDYGAEVNDSHVIDFEIESDMDKEWSELGRILSKNYTGDSKNVKHLGNWPDIFDPNDYPPPTEDSTSNTSFNQRKSLILILLILVAFMIAVIYRNT